MARTITKGLAPVVERLELDRPQVVTLRDIERICAEEGVGTEREMDGGKRRAALGPVPTPHLISKFSTTSIA